MSINLELVPILLSATVILNVLVAFVLMFNNPKKVVNQYYTWAVIGVALWALGDLLLSYAKTQQVMMAGVYLFYISPILIAHMLILLAEVFPDAQKVPNIKRHALYALPSIFLVAALAVNPEFILSNVEITAQGRNLVSNNQSGFFFYLLYFSAYFLTSYAIFLRQYFLREGYERLQILYAIVGIIVSSSLATYTNLILPFFGNTEYIWLGPLFTLLNVAAVTTAIVKHRLFDIRLLVARSIAYTLLLFTLAAIYGAAVFTTSSLFFSDLSVTARHIVYVTLAVFLAFTFQPLQRFFEYLTDRVFYRDRYDSSDVINQIGKVLASELLLENITNRVLNIVCRNLRVQTGQLIIFGGDRIYQAARFGSVPKIAPSYDKLSLLMEQMYVADEQEDNQVKDLLSEYQARLSLPLKTSEELSGLLLLGNKQSGGIYTSQDIELLQVIDDELAVGIQNAKAYQEIKEFNVKLRQWVEDATQQLRESNAKLRELDEAKDEFISMASHQLRTPLTTIKGYLSMLLEGDAGKLSDRQEEFLDLAFNSSQRMVSLITDLLNVSRINTGKFTIDKEEADLAKIVEEEVKQLRRYAENREVELSYNRPDQPVQLELDVNKTRQVIMNFIDNAIYYTPEGGWIKVELEQANGAVEFKVVDNGIGVPENEQEELFTKFYRASNAQEIRPAGTGLGLFMAKKVIKAQGGEIIFESAEGEGSTFGFRLAKSGPDQSSGSKTQAEATKEPVEKSATALHQ